jgi:lipid A 3-O-deacylase
MALRGIVATLGFVSAIALAHGARAQEVFAGAAAHDIDLGITACCSEHGVDVQVGARTAPFAHFIGGEVRAYVLGSANTSGGLDFGSVGLALRYPIADDRFYVQGGLGAALTNGSTLKFQATNDRLYLGSRVLFEPEVTVGWRLTHRWALEAAYSHLSHAQLAGAQNPGTDSLGLRLTWRTGR